MTEKNSMKELVLLVNDFFAHEFVNGKSIAILHKKLASFTRETRDVSPDFLTLLREICQYLKKIEYGDSKVQEYYSDLFRKTSNKKYSDVNYVLRKINDSLKAQ